MTFLELLADLAACLIALFVVTVIVKVVQIKRMRKVWDKAFYDAYGEHIDWTKKR